MAKVVLNTIGSRYGSIDALNANFAAIEEAFQNTVSRDGEGPNALEANLDAGSFRVINLPVPVDGSDAATKAYVDVATATIEQYAEEIGIVANNIGQVEIVGLDLNGTWQEGVIYDFGSITDPAVGEAEEGTSNIVAVAENMTSVVTVGTKINEVVAVSTNLGNVELVGLELNGAFQQGVIYDFGSITEAPEGPAEESTSSIVTVATNINAVRDVADNIEAVEFFSDNLAAIEAVNANATNINAVAAIASEIVVVEAISEAIVSVDANSTNITAVATNEDNITDVADNLTTITSVASNLTAINAVDANETNINAVVANATNINAVASNATNITAVAGNATNINTVAGNSTNINTVATNDTNITLVASNISSVNTVASNNTNVSTVATSIADVNTVAANIVDVQNAEENADAAIAAQAAAEAARDAALAALDSFDDRYLGQKSVEPTVDNDGDPLIAGALYFNTVANMMKVYDGAAWLAAYAPLTGALLTTNNLSDLTNVVTARSNLGLGALATKSTVTSSDLAATLDFGSIV